VPNEIINKPGPLDDGESLASRIMSCADAYSAMTTDRSYRSALGRDRAVAELERCAGKQFDPAVVAAAVRVVGRAASPPPEGLLAARAAVAAAAA
jgi:HD-GYP domain-containing protein (c-di-GMP phosphodiesterase class II)